MKTLLLLLVAVALAWAQPSTQVWKYKDFAGTTWSGWNEDGKYFEWETSGADSLTSRSFSLKYPGYEGLLALPVQVDTVGGSTGNISFKLHYFDGISWVESDGYLTFYVAPGGGSGTTTLGPSADGQRYFWLSSPGDSPSSADYGDLPIRSYRVEMFASGAVHVRVKMTYLWY